MHERAHGQEGRGRLPFPSSLLRPDHRIATLFAPLETINRVVKSSDSHHVASPTHSASVSFQPNRFTLMSAALIAVGVLLFIAIVLGLWAVGIYNSLVALRNRFKNAFAQIDVQLKRRYDLIPNLVETAKGYLKHERETLEAVIKARNIALAAEQTAAANPADAGAMRSLASAEGGLAGALSRLLVVSERYPELKANQNMMQLTEELTSTENKIAFARQAYNDSVMTYNNARETFPNVVLAGALGFQPAELFKVEEPSERNAPKVSFA